MSFILFFMGLALLGNVYENLTKKDTDKSESNVSPKASSYTKRDDYCLDERVERPVVHNHFTQNIYVQQTNHYYTASKESKDHTAKVWKELGYSVKYGETYAYKFYGNEIYRPDQVERIGNRNEPLQLEYGLTKNQRKVKQLGQAIVEKNHSKSLSKDILIDKYGFDEETAKYAVGYKGYNNW